jgi:hypothetical protein
MVKMLVNVQKLVFIILPPLKQCCGSGMFILDPGSEFFHPGSRDEKISDVGPSEI